MVYLQYKINGDVKYLDIERNVRIDNTSGVTGVSYNQTKNNWIASIIINGPYNYLGGFKNKQDAIIARLLKEKECFGNNAPQYCLFEQYNI